MTDHFEISLLKEPQVEFGGDFICDDPKMGIGVGGFYSHSIKSHKSEINIAVISTEQLVVDALNWIKNFENRILATETVLKEKYGVINHGEIDDENEIDDLLEFTEEENQQLIQREEEKIINKKYNPDFLGFNSKTQLNCVFQNNEGNNRFVKQRDLKSILENSELNQLQKLDSVIDMYAVQFNDLIENKVSAIDVCYIIIPTNVFTQLHSIKSSKTFINLRRKLKAQLIALQNTIPTQIIMEATIKGTKKSMQDLSMTAWNFCVASYYKAGCIPWALHIKDVDTCFIGISFNKVISTENNMLRSSVAQAFNREGQGLVFTWKNFLWNDEINKTKSPHLEYNYAKELIQFVLSEYQKINKHTPARIVIHKTTDFWNSNDSKEHNELGGLKDGIIEKLGEYVKMDFVTIKSSPVRIFRNFGIYPVPRGTCMKIDDKECILYTTGYIPYFELYPGRHIPHPLYIKIFESDSHLSKICSEIMALTKMNFNNCSYFDSLPITIRFSKKVGEILQYLPEIAIPQNKYYFYM
jgi:hypothetical protein